MNIFHIEPLVEKSPEGWLIKSDKKRNAAIRAAGRLDWDTEVLDFIKPHISSNRTMVDVGANIGTHTFNYLKFNAYSNRVIAYEPNPVAFYCLENNCPTATCFQFAVGKEQGVNKLTIEHGDSGLSHLTYGEEGYPVMMVSLDQHLPHITEGSIGFIKIDVEGCELEVLQGAQDTIDEYRPVLFIEVYEKLLATRGVTGWDVKEFLLNHSYDIICEPPWKQLGVYDYLNILCLPK